MSVGANDTVNVAVIGLGWPGQRHLEGYAKVPFVRVAAVCDAAEPLLAQTQAALGPNVRAVRDYHELLAMPDIDAVSVCLPNFLHAPISIAALEAGKHVLCEKPLANTLAEGERLTAAAHASGKLFMLALNNRFRTEIQALKRIVDAGELGQVYYAKAGWVRRRNALTGGGWFTEKAKSGGGPMIDLGVHMLDLTLWLMGNPKATRVSGAVYDLLFRELRGKMSGTVDVEDFAAAMIHLDNGAAIHLETSWVSFIEKEYVFSQLQGTHGGVLYERGTNINGGTTAYPPFTVFGSIGGEHVNAVPTDIPLTTEQMLYASFANEMRHFAECVRDNVQPIATVDQGLEILRILDAVYRSAEEGREIVLTPSAV